MRNASVLDSELTSPRRRPSPPPLPSQGTANIHSADDSDTATTREQQGQCPRCGQQLYKLPNAKLNWKHKLRLAPPMPADMPNMRKEPLTIPDKVQRGQCLVCSHAAAASASSSASDGTLVDAPTFVTATADTERHGLLQHNVMANTTTATNSIHLSNLASSSSSSSNNSHNVTYTGSYDSQHRFHDPNATLVWNDTGHVYKGAFVHGQRHGPGTLTFATGGEYVGMFAHNQMHGSATRRYPNGDVYVGDFCHNQRHSAQAHLYFANGDLYIGPFHQDCMQTSSDPSVNTGRYYYASGQRYQGSFYHNQRHGRGKLQTVDGMLNVYVYRQDQRYGAIGLRWNQDRSKVWTVACDTGKVKKKISVAEAVSLEYELQQEAERLWNQVLSSNNANGPEIGLADSVAASSVRGLMT